MHFLRSLMHLASKKWRAALYTFFGTLLPGACRWFAQEWAGNHIVDWVDSKVRQMNFGIVSVVASAMWNWMAIHPLQVVAYTTCGLVAFFAIETRFRDTKHREEPLAKSAEAPGSGVDRPMVVPTKISKINAGSLVRGLFLVNDGASAAYDVKIDPVQIGQRTLSFSNIPRLPSSSEGFAEPTLSDTSAVFSRDMKYVFEQWRLATNSANPTLNIRIHYLDRDGKEYATDGVIKFSMNLDDFVVGLRPPGSENLDESDRSLIGDTSVLLTERLHDQFLTYGESGTFKIDTSQKPTGILVSVTQLLDRNKAFPCSVLLVDLKRIDAGLPCATPELHKPDGGFKYGRVCLDLASADKNLFFNVPGSWWLVSQSGPQIRYYWGERRERGSIALQPGDWVASVEIEVADEVFKRAVTYSWNGSDDPKLVQ
jgi:hypothetical protein